MFLEAAGRGFGVVDWVFGPPEPVPYAEVVEVKENRDLRKGRKVNQDPYGGDAVIWDDTEFFNRSPEDDLPNEEQHAETFDVGDTDDFLYMQSNAVQRLAQVRRHLAEVAMRTRQEEDFRIAESFQFQQQHPCSWLPDPVEIKNTIPNITYHQEQPRSYIAPTLPITTPEMVNPEECVVVSFHCPQGDCLFNLELENQSLPDSDQPTACIHSGCGHCSGTLEEWMAHVLAPHHGEDPKLS